MKKHIKVTQWHISRGVPNSDTSCPIALAVRGKFGHVGQNISVQKSVVIFRKRYCLNANLPNRALTFIRLFDRSSPVKPIEFTLNFDLKRV